MDLYVTRHGQTIWYAENKVCGISDNSLIEQNYGIFEGVDRRKVNFQNNKKNFYFKYPGGESMLQSRL
jgi:bisphosphoglycerate-dependent phosphoglycerate mutase